MHERRFAFVLFGRVVTEIDICPAHGGGSRVRYRLTIAARGWMAAVLLRFGFLAAVGRTIDRIFRHAAGFAEGTHEVAFEPSAPRNRSLDPAAGHRPRCPEWQSPLIADRDLFADAVLRPGDQVEIRLQGESRGGDIVISEEMAQDPAVTALLEGLPRSPKTRSSKASGKKVALRRVLPLCASD